MGLKRPVPDSWLWPWDLRGSLKSIVGVFPECLHPPPYHCSPECRAVSIKDLAFYGKARFVNLERPLKLQHINHDDLSFTRHSIPVRWHVCVCTHIHTLYTQARTGPRDCTWLPWLPDLCRARALGHFPGPFRSLLTRAALTKNGSVYLVGERKSCLGQKLFGQKFLLFQTFGFCF